MEIEEVLYEPSAKQRRRFSASRPASAGGLLTNVPRSHQHPTLFVQSHLFHRLREVGGT